MVPKRRSRVLAQIDAEIQAKADAIVAKMKAADDAARQYVEDMKLRAEAARLAGQPDMYGLTNDELIIYLKAKRRELAAQSEAERRVAIVEAQSILGVSVRKIAAETGLSYGYVVQLRRKLGLSKARPRK